MGNSLEIAYPYDVAEVVRLPAPELSRFRLRVFYMLGVADVCSQVRLFTALTPASRPKSASSNPGVMSLAQLRSSPPVMANSPSQINSSAEVRFSTSDARLNLPIISIAGPSLQLATSNGPLLTCISRISNFLAGHLRRLRIPNITFQPPRSNVREKRW